MKRRSSMVLAFTLLASLACVAQERGRITVTVQTRADATSLVGNAVGAKVVVVHWTMLNLHPTMIQDQVATTDENGSCTLNLLPGVYDLFVSANGLAPYAAKIEAVAGENEPIVVTLKPGSMHLRPVD